MEQQIADQLYLGASILQLSVSRLSTNNRYQVLVAVGQGGILMKALQVAVPEDNHRKLTTAVSGILHNQGSNLEIDGLLTPGHTPNVTSRPMSKIKKDGRVSTLAQSKHSQELVSKPEAAENVQKSADTGQSQAMSSHGSGLSSLDKKDANNVENNNQKQATSSLQTEDKTSLAASPSETNVMENKGSDNVKREERRGQWKLLEQTGSNNDLSDVVIAHAKGHAEMQYDSPLKSNNMDNIIEPSSVIFDHENQNPDEELEALKVEVGWKVSTEDLEEMQPELSSELEHVANVISQAEGHEEELVSFIKTVHAEHVVHVISAAVHGTSYLRRVLPVGVIVGCSLAALRKFLMYMPKKVMTKAKS
ncbi:hypothetical protein FXO37_14822 [Capsicum annuum]|nr:hypothetical protein FXO37_14822 [Capsicum annuum]